MGLIKIEAPVVLMILSVKISSSLRAFWARYDRFMETDFFDYIEMGLGFQGKKVRRCQKTTCKLYEFNFTFSQVVGN
jgi:hypothetical protein